MLDSKERFSNRVETYVKYRPTYPREAIDYLYDVVGLSEHSRIADVGAGTGIFSKLLLERGSYVTALEPNAEMREAAVLELKEFASYEALGGSAEETGLKDHSVNFIVCAQSFHWFDQTAAQLEFRRILKPGGKVVLIWNSRQTTGSSFLEQYEQLLLTFATDYDKVGHKSITQHSLGSFFAKGGPHLERFAMRQLFDEQGLTGRLLSSSYSPLPGDANYERMIQELHELFIRNEQSGTVAMEYATELYWGEV